MPVTERKLVAILSADVVGYSRLMAEDDLPRYTHRCQRCFRIEYENTHLQHLRGARAKLASKRSSLCDRAMIDLVEGDVDGAWVRYERGLACYEEGGYLDHAAAAREMWEQAAAS